MTDVAVTGGARRDLAGLMQVLLLPDDTPERVMAALRRLERFPRMGRLVPRDEHEEIRYVLGPWRWMVVLYLFDQTNDRVVVLTVQDARSSSGVTSR